MLKRKLTVLGLVILLVGVIAPAAVVLADEDNDTSAKITSLEDVKEGVPISLYMDEKGNIEKIEYGIPDGYKVEVLKEDKPSGKSTGMHNKTPDLWDTNRTWIDYGHPFHYFEEGDRQATWCSWTPDDEVACFVGVYFEYLGYAIGLTNPSANNVLVTAGDDGYTRPYIVYWGDRQYWAPSHFTINYYPWW